MSTTETIRAWATTNAANATADAAITSADTQSPDTIDNNIRSVMAADKKQQNDLGGSLAAGGSANALTVTTNQVLEAGQLVAGLRLLIRATADNSSATVTFAPDTLTAANIKRADGSALAVGSIKSGMYLDLVYNAVSSEWRCANIAPLQPATGLLSPVPGLNLLASGTVAAATLDIVLTSYGAYKGIKIYLTGFLPATDGAQLYLRFSTNGGSSYIASGYNWADTAATDSALTVPHGSGSDTKIAIGATVGNGANEGINAEVTLMNQTSAAFWPRVTFSGYHIDDSATPTGVYVTGGGSNETAQDVDAVRFLFSTGNISAGNYIVYGLV